MKISEYEKIERLNDQDVFLLSTVNGTKTVDMAGLYWSIASKLPLPNRRFIYRGKNLGTEFTPEQRKAVQDGSFDDLFIGDYWENPEVISPLGGMTVRWMIVDLDYIFGVDMESGTPVMKHSIMIMPDQCIGNGNVDRMSDLSYKSSPIRASLDNQTDDPEKVHQQINTIFGVKNDGSPRLVQYADHLPSEVDSNNGITTKATYAACLVELPSTSMLFGSANANYGTLSLGSPSKLSYGKQFSLFAVKPELIGGSNEYWLRDMVGKSGNKFYFAVGTYDSRLDRKSTRLNSSHWS